MPDSKPFTCEREANDAPASRRAREAVDAMFRAGTFKPGDHEAPNTAIVLDALKAAGVEISDWEAGTFRWLGGWETYHSVIIARVIEAAYEAGRTPEPGTRAEWRTSWDDGLTADCANEQEARLTAKQSNDFGKHPLAHAEYRTVGPWKEAPDG